MMVLVKLCKIHFMKYGSNLDTNYKKNKKILKFNKIISRVMLYFTTRIYKQLLNKLNIKLLIIWPFKKIYLKILVPSSKL